MNQNSSPRKGKTHARYLERGMSATEFVLVVPAFLMLLLCCLEFGLMAMDRHLLTAAGVSAARGVLIEASDTPSGIPAYNPLLPNAGAQECALAIGADGMNRAKRKSAFKMSATAPTLTELMAKTGFPLGNALDPFLNEIDRHSKSLKRVLLGYPVAVMQTKISKCTFDKNGVTLTLKYNRYPRTPFAGNAMWALYALTKINKHTDPALRLHLKGDFYGVGIESPAIEAMRSNLIGHLRSMRTAGASLTQLSSSLDAVPELRNRIPLNELQRLQTSVDSSFQRAEASINEAASAGISQLNAQENVAAAAIYSVPEALRFIPMEKTIFLAWSSTGFQRQDSGDWKANGANIFVAPYKGSAGDSAEQVKLWEQWAKELSQSQYEWNE